MDNLNVLDHSAATASSSRCWQLHLESACSLLQMQLDCHGLPTPAGLLFGPGHVDIAHTQSIREQSGPGANSIFAIGMLCSMLSGIQY